jgi:hypothetical protein
MLKSSVFGILLVVFIGDTLSNHENMHLVSDTIIINAPVETVWPFVVEYEPIVAKEDYWLFAIGMPSPVQSTVNGRTTSSSISAGRSSCRCRGGTSGSCRSWSRSRCSIGIRPSAERSAVVGRGAS